MNRRWRSLAGLMLGLGVAGNAWAAWPSDPTVNVPLCTASGDQADVTSTGDGSGGILSVWRDTRSGTGTAIYAQRVNGAGNISAGWSANGLQLCLASGDRMSPAMVSDGSGGAIVVWADGRAPAGTRIYAQHALATGIADPAWPVNGRLLASATGNQSDAVLVADGAGGAIVAWSDQRAGDADVYAQHVRPDGSLDPAWPAAGRAVVAAADNQWYPAITADGAGGALLVWQDEHVPGNVRLFAHHLGANGTLDAAWPPAGSLLCAPGDLREHARLVTDGAGGAIVVWQDGRSGTNYDIYAHRVRSNGVIDPAWPVDGRALCLDGNDQLTPVIASDGVGGAIVAWEDYRSGAADIFVHHVRGNGTVDPAWTPGGDALCVAAGYQVQPALVVDAGGNTIVAWEDHRSSSADIYAGRITSNGRVDSTWTINGVVVCSESHDQFTPTAVADGAGGLVTAWADSRGAAGSYDVYAQRVTQGGQVGGSIVGVAGGPAAGGLALVASGPARATALSVRFTLASGATARLELLDVGGRRLATHDLGGYGPGTHTVGLDADLGGAPAGIYFLRLTQGDGSATSRFALLR